MAKLFNSLESERTGYIDDIVELVTGKVKPLTDSHNAKVLMRSESCSGLNDSMKEVNGEAEFHPVIVPPGETKALYDFAEISRALYHAEEKVIARGLKTKPRKFKRKERKQIMIIKHMENVDLESDAFTLEVVY